MKNADHDSRDQNSASVPSSGGDPTSVDTAPIPWDILADLEATLEEVAGSNPRIREDSSEKTDEHSDLRALLEATLAINSSLVLDDVLQTVMLKAIELMQAERGLIMLLDDTGQLQVKSAYNLCKEEMMEEDFRISSSVTSQVARSGRPIYTSDALADDRYAQHKSVVELHLRSIMCVPVVVKEQVIGVIYLDNSSQAKMFLKSDLYLFQLYAQLVSSALHNASIYESLLRLELYNESVVDSSPVGIVVLNIKGELVTINPAALEIFDLNRDTFQADKPRAFLECLPSSEQSRWHSMITTTLATRQEFSDPRFYHDTKFLKKVLSIKLCPLRGLPDGGEGLIMAVEDVTEKITMEQYVILSEKLVAKGEMAASVAHELNNYLSIISNNAELMGINIERNKLDKVKFNARSITDNIQKIKRFVDNLMDFSRPESEYVSYNLRTLIDDVLFSLRIQSRFKAVRFTLDLDPEISDMEMDVGQIQQVLMNLLINAADAISEQATSMEEQHQDYRGTIGISTSRQPDTDQVTMKISDNGIGMTEETLAKVFTLHFSTKSGGHGLGLHNCRKIIELHQGEISLQSRKHEGTTFVITLPRLQPGEKQKT